MNTRGLRLMSNDSNVWQRTGYDIWQFSNKSLLQHIGEGGNVIRLFILGAFSVLVGCAQLSDIHESLFSDPRAENAETQRIFDQRKTEIENQARGKRINWVESARRIRELDRSFVGQGTWIFNSYDEEYHACCIALAEQVDIGRLTYAQYDAMRTRRFNEIQQRRAR